MHFTAKECAYTRRRMLHPAVVTTPGDDYQQDYDMIIWYHNAKYNKEQRTMNKEQSESIAQVAG